MAYSKQTWDTNSIFNPTRMNNIENGIAGIKEATLLEVTPATDETWGSLISRVKTSFGNYTSWQKLRMTVENNANMVFNNVRSGGSTIWFSSRGSGSAIVFYLINTSSSSQAFRKYQIGSDGLTVEDMTDYAAESSIRLLGLNNNE